jgi:diadenosine tetraphosphate (Ap4A) HIT family hydrolase
MSHEQMPDVECILCRGAEADGELERIEVWQDSHWRLTVSLSSEVPGFAYLEPKRHISHIHELDGEEAHTFGAALAKCTRALREATNTEVVYIYVFGDGVPHLHVHLAPHRSGDALSDQMIRGEIVEEKLPNGMTRFYSREFPALPRDTLARTAEGVRKILHRK